MDNFVKFFDSVSFEPHVTDEVKDFYAGTISNQKPLNIRIAATHAGKITRNNGFYLPHKMQIGAETFVSQYQKPVQVHHESKKDPIGRIVSSNYIDLSQNIKDAWDIKQLTDAARPMSCTLLDAFVQGHLTDQEMIDVADNYFIKDFKLVSNPDYQGLGYIELVAQVTDPDAIQKVLDRRYLTGSVGATTNKAVCSVCKQDWAHDGKCKHSPGRIYDGSKCVLIAGDLSYDEWSFVNKPASFI